MLPKLLPLVIAYLVCGVMTDSTGEWEVVERPYTTSSGKNAHVRVQPVKNPGVTVTKMSGAYEKVSVRRA